MGHARRAGVAGAGGSCGGVWGRLPGGRLAQRAHHAHRRVLSAGRPPRARAARAAARVPRAAPSGAASAPAGCCAARRAGKQHRHGQAPAGPCWPCRAGAPRQWLQGPQGARRTRPHPAPAWPHERARLGAALQVPVGRAAVWRGAREVDGRAARRDARHQVRGLAAVDRAGLARRGQGTPPCPTLASAAPAGAHASCRRPAAARGAVRASLQCHWRTLPGLHGERPAPGARPGLCVACRPALVLHRVSVA